MLQHRREEAKWSDHAEFRTLGAAVEFRNTLLGNDNPLATPAFALLGVPHDFAGEMIVKTAKYISGNFGAFIGSPEFDSAPPFAGWSREDRDAVREIVRANPAVTPEELNGINAVLKPIFENQIEQGRRTPYVIPAALLALALGILCVSQFFSLLIFGATPGQRLFGFAVVNKRGDIAGRGRMLVRWLIVWLPLALLLMRFIFNHGQPMTTGTIVWLSAKMFLWLACLGLAVARPERGLHDEMAGTRLVPR